MKEKMKKEALNLTRKRKYFIYKCQMFLYISAFLFFIFYCFRLPIYNSILDSDSKQIEAWIIDETNTLGKGHIIDNFTFSYKFNVDDNSYYGDSKDQRYKVGYKIMVEYWPTWPFINRPIKDDKSKLNKPYL